MKTEQNQYECPECTSHNLLVYEVTAYNVNTLEFYCHAVKAYDSDARVECLDCTWKGTKSDLDTKRD